MNKEKNEIQSHTLHMRRCIVLAKEALKTGNSPVGSILVCNDSIIGEGIEAVKSTKDITNHSELLAIRDAIAKGHIDKLSKSTLYSTHEPCVMCSYGIRFHKIPLIVFGISVEHIGGATSKFNILNTDAIPSWSLKPKIIANFLQEECKEVAK